ncbi:MAG TPA: hypothetical protein VM935_03675 [Chitinophagaceae bacterium]|nr:hypothetical protein [Chitinophagaceae bacterium]
MSTLKFKTSIKCSGCVAKSTPYLNEAVGEDNWEIDLQSPQKTLTVETEEESSEAAVINALRTAGYVAERID